MLVCIQLGHTAQLPCIFTSELYTQSPKCACFNVRLSIILCKSFAVYVLVVTNSNEAGAGLYSVKYDGMPQVIKAFLSYKV